MHSFEVAKQMVILKKTVPCCHVQSYSQAPTLIHILTYLLKEKLSDFSLWEEYFIQLFSHLKLSNVCFFSLLALTNIPKLWHHLVSLFLLLSPDGTLSDLASQSHSIDTLNEAVSELSVLP